MYTCMDPGIFAGGSRGGGGSRSNCQITALTFSCVFLVLNLFYSFTEGVQWLFKRKPNFPRFQRGPTFSRGEGVQMLVSIETVYPPSESMHDIQVCV